MHPVSILLAAAWFATPAIGRLAPDPAGRPAPRTWKVPDVDPKYCRPAPDTFSDRRCLSALRSLKVPFRSVTGYKSVATPVQIIGDHIGRIRYVPRYQNKPSMVMDCRLALALKRGAELFRANGIRAVVYSNFYSYRHVVSSGRLSRHALGLAADVHGFVGASGEKLDVQSDYERGLGQGATCEGRAKTKKGRTLRDLACDLDASLLFETVLTPDYDAGHANHFHLSVHHPMDPRRYRLFRTVLNEVRRTMHPWTWALPPRAGKAANRVDPVVRRRRQVLLHAPVLPSARP
jgi:hypothetical protein